VPPRGWRLAAIAAGIAAATAILALDSPLHRDPALGSRPALAAAVTALMAIWWLTDALRMEWVACIPLLIYPFFHVRDGGFGPNLGGALLPYFDPYIFLFLGGMCIAAAMQQWNLHRRIALAIMRAIGTEPPRLLAGFLVATAFVSLWISNTATAVMMFPIGLAVIAQFESRSGRRLAHYGAAIMLSIAYAANVGGIGTKIGTAPNALFASFMAQRGDEIGFLAYMGIGIPFVALFLPLVWVALWREGRRDALAGEEGAAAVREESARLVRISRGEQGVLAVFVLACALWIGAQPLTALLAPSVTSFRLGSAHVEAGVSMLAALLLLAWPVGGTRALALASLRYIPFGTLVLLGGSLSMAAGIEASGLGRWLAAALSGVHELPLPLQLVGACLASVALSAVASNVATIAIMLPVLAGAVAPEHAHTVLFGATIAASCDFALPAGTPPNAIVFASGYVTIPRMARIGVRLDLAAALLAALWCLVAVPLVL
jgi:sodium-dependent dicarboxylate transporter 2/3/5